MSRHYPGSFTCAALYSTPDLSCYCSLGLVYMDLFLDTLNLNVSSRGFFVFKIKLIPVLHGRALITCYASGYCPGDVVFPQPHKTQSCPQRVNKLKDVWTNCFEALRERQLFKLQATCLILLGSSSTTKWVRQEQCV